MAITENKKRQLESLSDEHKEALENEIEELLEKGKKIAKSALLVGGSFALSYYMINKLTKKDKVKIKKTSSPLGNNELMVEKQPSLLSNIGGVILTELTVFILAIAKEKLIEYIQNIDTSKKADEREKEHSTNTAEEA